MSIRPAQILLPLAVAGVLALGGCGPTGEQDDNHELWHELDVHEPPSAEDEAETGAPYRDDELLGTARADPIKPTPDPWGDQTRTAKPTPDPWKAGSGASSNESGGSDRGTSD